MKMQTINNKSLHFTPVPIRKIPLDSHALWLKNKNWNNFDCLAWSLNFNLGELLSDTDYIVHLFEIIILTFLFCILLIHVGFADVCIHVLLLLLLLFLSYYYFFIFFFISLSSSSSASSSSFASSLSSSPYHLLL